MLWLQCKDKQFMDKMETNHQYIVDYKYEDQMNEMLKYTVLGKYKHKKLKMLLNSDQQNRLQEQMDKQNTEYYE